MAERNNDELADALRGLSSGEYDKPAPRQPASRPTPKPVQRAAAPVARQTPAAPSRPSQPPAPGAAPQPRPSVTAPPSAPAYSPPPQPTTSGSFSASRTVPKFAQMESRRTMIPILLTLGVTFIVLAVMTFVLDPDSALGTIGRTQKWLSYVLILSGVISITLGVLSMIQVKNLLAASANPPR